MKYIVAILLFITLAVPVTLILPILSSFLEPKPIFLVSPLASSIGLISFDNLSTNSKQTVQASIGVNSLNKKSVQPVNILLLGFDGRRGDGNPRCDAIHMFSFNPASGKILITTVPRGTVLPIPELEAGSAYIANACHIMGADFAVKKIEKITGIHPDYVVKAGFSQALGIFRLAGLPATPTLQYLRNRRYGIGDYQRSYNQAVFFKDMIVKYLEQFAKLPQPVQYLAFKMIDTDMSFDTAKNLLDGFIASKTYQDPQNITLVTKPADLARRREYHLEDKLQQETNWQFDPEYQEYQNNFDGYLENLIKKADKYTASNKPSSAFRLIGTPFSQKLWLQVEEEDRRNQLHYDFLRIYTLGAKDKETGGSLIQDFITEMDTFNHPDLKKKAEELLGQIS